MATSPWRTIPDNETLYAGEKYRITLTLRVPYSPALFETLKAAWKSNAALSGKLIIDGFSYWVPNTITPTGGVLPDTWWYFRVEYHPNGALPSVQQSGLDPRAVWALAALIIGTIAALAIAGQRMEKLLHAAGEESRGTLRELFNPGVLVLAVVGIFLITRRG